MHNLLSPLEQSNVLHVDVCFGTPPSLRLAEQLDAAIGRAACAHAPVRRRLWAASGWAPPAGSGLACGVGLAWECAGRPQAVSCQEATFGHAGRTAHISFLENASFLQLFGQTYLEYFV